MATWGGHSCNSSLKMLQLTPYDDSEYFLYFSPFYSMPRQWKRKTDRGVPADILRKAAIEFRQGKIQ